MRDVEEVKWLAGGEKFLALLGRRYVVLFDGKVENSDLVMSFTRLDMSELKSRQYQTAIPHLRTS